jgi:hypothetical protein
MLALTDAQMDAILLAAKPLRPRDRDGFLKTVVTILDNSHGPVGDGDVNRAVRAAVKTFFDPPQLGNTTGAISKYR